MSEILAFACKLFTVGLVRYFLVAGIAFLLMYKVYARKFVSNKIQQRSALPSDFKREILHSVLSNGIMVVETLPFYFPPLSKYTLQYSSVAVHGWGYLFLSVGIALIIHDTYFYWMHRLVHHPRIFPYVHLLHHRSTNPSPWAAYAFHAWEALAEGFILVILLFILPLHSLAIFLFILSSFAINVYGHLGYEIMPRRFRHHFLFGILNTSVYHNLHHSKFKGNYGLYFRFWDRVMGTEHPDYIRLYDAVQARRFPLNPGETS